MAPRPPFPLFSQIAKKVFFNDEGLLKDMLSLTLTLGWKNEKRPSGPIELDLEAGNLVFNYLQLKVFCGEFFKHSFIVCKNFNCCSYGAKFRQF